ncbi:MAG: hypothetical protein ACI835_004239 [Planctomycetota bacterium]|jgi:hypothetical protein
MMLYASFGMGVAIVNGYCQSPAGTLALPIPELPSFDYFVLTRSTGHVPASAKELLRVLRVLTSKRSKR